jgi:hypothetical protein
MINTTNTIQEQNTKAMNNIQLAQRIINIIQVNPKLANVKNRDLHNAQDSRWNGHFIADKYHEIISVYGAQCYNNIAENKEIPAEVKTFFRDAHNYLHNTNI